MIIGIDPGKTGALALFGDGGQLIEVVDMPLIAHGDKMQINAVELANMIRNYQTMATMEGRQITAFIEWVNGQPARKKNPQTGQVEVVRIGGASLFNFGMGYGFLIMAMAALQIPMELVTPGKWKKHHSLTGKPKDNARTLAQQLFPTASLARKKDIDRADAILIGLYGHQTSR